MKRFALPLGLIAFALACTDASAPDPHALMAPKNPMLVAGAGNIPPPPVDAAIGVIINSPEHGVFTGAYFANGLSIDALAASIELNDQSLGLGGTAWLRFDNKQAAPGLSASANTRFQVSSPDMKMSGMGTLTFGIHTFRIVSASVKWRMVNPGCNFGGDPCAVIEFDAIDEFGVTHFRNTAQAFNRATADCTLQFHPGDGEEIPPFFSCDSGGG